MPGDLNEVRDVFPNLLLEENKFKITGLVKFLKKFSKCRKRGLIGDVFDRGLDLPQFRNLPRLSYIFGESAISNLESSGMYFLLNGFRFTTLDAGVKYKDYIEYSFENAKSEFFHNFAQLHRKFKSDLENDKNLHRIWSRPFFTQQRQNFKLRDFILNLKNSRN
jgi:hypothetical protein